MLPLIQMVKRLNLKMNQNMALMLIVKVIIVVALTPKSFLNNLNEVIMTHCLPFSSPATTEPLDQEHLENPEDEGRNTTGNQGTKSKN